MNSDCGRFSGGGSEYHGGDYHGGVQYAVRHWHGDGGVVTVMKVVICIARGAGSDDVDDSDNNEECGGHRAVAGALADALAGPIVAAIGVVEKTPGAYLPENCHSSTHGRQ